MSFQHSESKVFSLIASNMRQLRSLYGWSRDDLASRLGWSAQQLTTYELALAEPKIRDLLHFAHFFSIEPEVIITGDTATNTGSSVAARPTVTTFIPTNLSEMILQTEDIKKMITGFRAFHELQMQRCAANSADFQRWNQEYQETITLLEEYLVLNQRIIAANQK